MSLFKNIQFLAQADEGYIDLTDEEITEITDDLKNNVDKIKSFTNFLNYQEDLADAEIKKWTARKKTAQNNIKRTSNYVIASLEAGGWESLTGKNYSVKIRQTDTETVHPQYATLTTDQYVDLIEIDGSLANAKYSPDKKAFKDFHKKNPGILDNWMHVKTTKSVKWGDKK